VSGLARKFSPPVAEPREVLSVLEAADFLGLSRNCVYEYANRGTIPCQRVGRRLLFSRTALVRWLSACTPEGPSKG
jgi:excisionase family DNA binding protein